MNNYLLLIGLAILLATPSTTYAQPRPRQTPMKAVPKAPAPPRPDILVRRDGTQLEVLVTEITDKEIVYKRASNPNGPVFRAQKSDFNYLQYGTNGEIEQFTKVAQPAPAPPQPVPTAVQPAPAPTTAPRAQYAPAPVYPSRQADISQGVRFGLKGGVQSASFSISPSSLTNKGVVGFQAGIIVDKPLGKSARFRPQLLYSGKGNKLVNPSTNANLSISLNYIEVPIDFLFKIPTSSGQFLLGGGLYSGYALGGKIGSADATIGNNRTNDFTTLDFGLRASAWYDLSSGLTLNTFYNFGLSDINPSPSAGDPTIKNRTFGLGVGYFLSR